MDVPDFLEAEILRNEHLAEICPPEMRPSYMENVSVLRQIVRDELELDEYRRSNAKNFFGVC